MMTLSWWRMLCVPCTTNCISGVWLARRHRSFDLQRADVDLPVGCYLLGRRMRPTCHAPWSMCSTSRKYRGWWDRRADIGAVWCFGLLCGAFLSSKCHGCTRRRVWVSRLSSHVPGVWRPQCCWWWWCRMHRPSPAWSPCMQCHLVHHCGHTWHRRQKKYCMLCIKVALPDVLCGAGGDTCDIKYDIPNLHITSHTRSHHTISYHEHDISKYSPLPTLPHNLYHHWRPRIYYSSHSH